jgi:RecB family endonuclease NucS
MRLVIAQCSVDYAGRLAAHLPSAKRLLIHKSDGSVLVHSDGGSYKPLNWMSPPCTVKEEPGLWTVTNKAGEKLIIRLEEVFHDGSHELGVRRLWLALGQRARRAHPVERLVGTAVAVHQHAAIGLDQQQPGC